MTMHLDSATAVGGRWHVTGAVFSNNTTTKVNNGDTDANARSRWPMVGTKKSYLARVGIIRKSACCLLCRARHKRHSFGSLLLDAGAPLAYVSEQMGHADTVITAQI